MTDPRPCDGCGTPTPDDQLVTIAGKSVCARCKPDMVLNLKSGVGGAPQVTPERAAEIKKRLSKLNLISFGLALPGFALMIGGPAVLAGMKGGAPELVVLMTILRIVGVALLIGGFAAYAMMKGRSPVFALLGLASCIGLLVLALIGKVCQNCHKAASYRLKQCKECGAPM